MRENSLSARPLGISAVPASRGLWQFGTSVLLVMCLIQYSGAWLYPAVLGFGVEVISPEKKLGTQFQLLLWVAIALGVVMHTLQRGFGPFFSILKVFLPFWLAGLVASLWGFDPFTSLHYFILWTLALLAGALIGTELGVQRAARVMVITLLVLLLGSILMALLVPTVGAQRYGGDTVWRGLFTNKNQLGWVAAMALVLTVGQARRMGKWLSGLLGLLACACLLFSGSKGALVAALATLGFAWLMSKLAPRVTVGFGVCILAFLVVVLGVFGFLVLPYILEALGRDMTLTGRTDVWSIFFRSMSDTLWFGQGPASYTAISPFTAPLALKLQSLGAIYTPHNTYLGVLGDSGLFGLVCFLGVLGYLTFVAPLSIKQPIAFTTSAIGFLMMAHGIVETHEIFAAGIGWFLLALARALTVQHVAAPALLNVGANPAPAATASYRVPREHSI